MADEGMQLILALMSMATGFCFFATAAFAHFIKGMIKEGKFTIIFPYLSVGMVCLGLMMIVYIGVFLSDRPIVAPLTSVLFFCGAISMMLGAYKVTKALDEAQATAQRKKEEKKKK